MAITLDGTTGITAPGVTDTGNLSVTGTSTLTGAVSQTSSSTAASFIPTGSTVPANGMYLSAANTLNLATNTTNQVSISSAGIVTGTAGNLMLVQGAVQASTSGTSVNFTSVIPSWAKRVRVALNGVSVSGTNNITIQLGTGGTATITGYVAQTTGIANSVGNTLTSTVGVPIWTNLAAYVWSGVVTFQLVSGNIWVASGVCGNTASTPLSSMSSGTVTLAGVLDTIRVISSATGAPSDSFDAGSINIQWE